MYAIYREKLFGVLVRTANEYANVGWYNSMELAVYTSEDEKLVAKVFQCEKTFLVRFKEEGFDREDLTKNFSNLSMAEYWADDTIIEYDLNKKAD